MPIIGVLFNGVCRLKLVPSNIVVCSQLRWKKTPKRKPRWLPMAPTKVFRIPQHPYEHPDEVQLRKDLLEEYYRNIDSLRKLFQDEIKQNSTSEDDNLVLKKEEEEFKLLLEENKRENERIKKIREETLEKEFQEKQLQYLQMAEEKQQEQNETKLRIEEIVRAEKEKSKGYITLQNIDQIIEDAIDNPVNYNFVISVDGKVKWEGKPSLTYEADIHRRVAKSKEA